MQVLHHAGEPEAVVHIDAVEQLVEQGGEEAQGQQAQIAAQKEGAEAQPLLDLLLVAQGEKAGQQEEQLHQRPHVEGAVVEVEPEAVIPAQEPLVVVAGQHADYQTFQHVQRADAF